MYEATPYDKRFVEILDYLIDTRRTHQRFKTGKDFLKKIGINDTNYPQIRKFKRGIPLEQRDEIIAILEHEFLVNGMCIKAGQMPKFLNETGQTAHEAAPLYMRTAPAFDVHKRIKELEDLVKQKDSIIKQQTQIIEVYKSLERTSKV